MFTSALQAERPSETYIYRVARVYSNFISRRHEKKMDDTSGRSVQAPVVDGRGHGVRLLYHEHPQGQDTLINRCLPQDASVQAEGQYRMDVLGDFTGRASYRQTARKLAWAAELERSSRQGWTRQRQLRATLAHNTDRLQLECEAWQRRYALLLGGFVEESAALKLSADRPPDAELSASVDVGATRLTSTVRTDLHQGSLLELETGPIARLGNTSTSLVSSSARSGNIVPDTIQGAGPAERPAAADMAATRTRSADVNGCCRGGAATGPPCGNVSADGIGGAEICSEGAELMCGGWEGVITGGQGQQSSRLEQRLERLSSSASRASGTDPKHEAAGRAQKEENKRVGKRASNSLQQLRTYVAFPFGARSRGGWRLELRQRLGRSLQVDARLKGGHVKLREGDLIEYNSLTTPGNVPAPVASSDNGLSTSAAMSAGKSAPGPLQAFLKLALQREGTPWSASLALGSKSAGPALSCGWRRQASAQQHAVPALNSKSNSAAPQKAVLANGAHGRAMWHSWHLNRVEIAARERTDVWPGPWVEARAVLKGWTHQVASAQAKLFLPL
ncbi:g5258 [Coccomyxa elongata]